ncbi:MAG: phosphate ABC transporter permease PstA [Desulfomonilaceae bacterium]
MHDERDVFKIEAQTTEAPESSETTPPGAGADLTSQSGSNSVRSLPNADRPKASEDRTKIKKSMVWDFKSRGEPFLWPFGGALIIGIFMIIGFLILILYNGILTFYPDRIEVLSLRDGSVIAGELTRSERFRPSGKDLEQVPQEIQNQIAAQKGFATRQLYHIGNFDLYDEDYRWISNFDITKVTRPMDIFFLERMEWGPFIGTIKSLDLNGRIIPKEDLTLDKLRQEQQDAARRRNLLHYLERNEIGAINYYLEKGRLELRKLELRYGADSPTYQKAAKDINNDSVNLEARYQDLSKEAAGIRDNDARYTITLVDAGGREKTMKLSNIVRMYPANVLTVPQRLGVYFSRWREFLTQEPREANTEGGVLPAIFGTFCMTILMAIAVAPFGVVAALYLREYAKQGRLVSLVRICVNNLAGVPSIVYGVFGLGFFAYMLGTTIDELFFSEKLPTPTYGTGGLLWASLTLALLTVPVVIVATEEALAAVPQSLREGSLACGASKWQTIKYVVLPRAMPGIMTGLILAMARGAGEVAPLMLIGVVKMAPELPIDGLFPYLHLERSFMHLGFHIYDLGFQSRNAEAAKPMVYVTTLLLITLVFVMNIASVMLRNRLRRKFFAGHF